MRSSVFSSKSLGGEQRPLLDEITSDEMQVVVDTQRENRRGDQKITAGEQSSGTCEDATSAQSRSSPVWE
jgi:hypothetical protein